MSDHLSAPEVTAAMNAVLSNLPLHVKAESLKLAFPAVNGSCMFYVSDSGRIQSVVKVFNLRANPLMKIDSPTRLDIPGVVPQIRVDHREYVIIWREFVKRPMSADMLAGLATAGDIDPEESAQVVTGFTRSLLNTLVRLHARGYVHGYLHPDVVSIEDDGRIRIRDIGIPQYFARTPDVSQDLSEELELQYVPRRYVPRERLIDPTSRPTASGDIWAFFSLALDALKPYRGSRAAESLDLLDSRIRWLKECFELTPERPSAASLQRILFGSGRDSYDGLRQQVRRIRVTVPIKSPKIKRQNVADRMVENFRKNPETTLALVGKGRLRQLRRLLALIDGRRPLVYYGSKRKPSEDSSDFRAKVVTSMDRRFEPDKFPPEIDDLWRDRIHEAHFGFPLDAAHEWRMAVTDFSEDDVQRRELYLRSITQSNRARRQLLEESRFLTTAGVISELKQGRNTLTREDVLIARRWGAILAVPDHGRWLYPEFQFREGSVSPVISLLYDKQRERLGGRQADPWDLLTYLSVKRKLLGGVALKDCLWERGKLTTVQQIVERARF